MPKFHSLLQGAIELHCHSHPSIFPRKQTDWELVEDIKASGMAGVVLKSHESQTVERAELIRMKEPGIHVYGGLVCNHFTGGLSPYTVDTAIRLGAKVIWMPTVSSHEHCDHFAKKKTRFFNSQKPLNIPTEGLEIWDKDRKLKSEVYDILDLIAEANIVLATGHLSAEEVSVLVDAAVERKVERILIQHADLGIAPVPLDMQIKLAQKGAIIEKCYLACSVDFQDLTVEEMAHGIQQIGADHCVMVTDYGQVHNMPPIEALSKFVEEMLKTDITEQQIQQMIVHNPHKLLSIN